MNDDARVEGKDAPDNSRGVASDGASYNGKGVMSDDTPASECAPGDSRGAESEGTPDTVLTLSCLWWGLALSATLERVSNSEIRGSIGGGRGGERQIWVNDSARFSTCLQ